MADIKYTGIDTLSAFMDIMHDELDAKASLSDLATKLDATATFGVGTATTSNNDLNNVLELGRHSWGSLVAETMANNPLNTYTLLTTQPEDWATNYMTKYFTKETTHGVDIYSHIPESQAAPEFVADTYYSVTRAVGGTLIVENVQNANRIRQTVIPNDTLAAAGTYYVRFYASSYSGAWSEWFEFKSAKSMFEIMTQAEYDAITTKTADVYFIYEE